MKRVHHIATSWNGRCVAVGAFERRVAVWDLVACRQVGEFDTVLDFGGRRLAITSDGRRVLAGAYHRYGIACYDASSGELLWQRKDLKKVQHITVSADDASLYCGFEMSAGRALEIATGEVTETMRGVGEVHESPFESLLFVDKKSRPAELRALEQGRRGKIERTTFAFLSVAFAPDFVLTSESGGPLRCFRTSDAAEVWRFTPASGSHALHVGFDESSNLFQAIVWPYERSAEHTLSRLDAATGELKAVVKLPESPDYGFCQRGSRALTWDGSLVDTSNGELVAKFDFPDVSRA